MKIATSCICPPIPSRNFDWAAVDEDTYDGAEDSANRHQVGYGPTAVAAIENLIEILHDDAETCPPDCWACKQEAQS